VEKPRTNASAMLGSISIGHLRGVFIVQFNDSSTGTESIPSL
jgi:hypothetical protein